MFWKVCGAARWRLAVAACALWVFQGCGEVGAPSGEVRGVVEVEGEGLEGVEVRLSGGGLAGSASALTSGGGEYGFGGLAPGVYVVEALGLPLDAEFGWERASVSVGEGMDVARADFAGEWVRTSGVAGAVLAEGRPVLGAVVELSGTSSGMVEADSVGAYAFAGLRAGLHVLEVGGFDAGVYGIEEARREAELEAGRVAVVDFEGVLLRTAGIAGRVLAEGEAQAGVVVRVSSEWEAFEARTDSMGEYFFGGLVPGGYLVEISGFDASLVAFAERELEVEPGPEETARADFEGALLRTAAVAGRVLVEGEPLAGALMRLSGREEREARTDSLGEYVFGDLVPGGYLVEISGFDASLVAFAERELEVEPGPEETARADFEGALLRTAAVAGRVLVEGEPLAGVLARLSGREERGARTDARGEYFFGELLPGVYSVAISGFDASLVAFAERELEVEPGPEETARADFGGVLLRTASVAGRVLVEGEPLAGALMRLSGREEREARTDAQGEYFFGELLPGAYLVAISGFDAEAIAFAELKLEVEPGPGETARADFDGALLRTAAVGGRVSADGDPISGVRVSLSGAHHEAEATSDGGGEYLFEGVVPGVYRVRAVGYDAGVFDFSAAGGEVRARSGGLARLDVAGKRRLGAEVRGRVMVEGIPISGARVRVAGPSGELEAVTDAEGRYVFRDLLAGEYEVEVEAEGARFASRLVRAGVDGAAVADFEGEYELGVLTVGESVELSLESAGRIEVEARVDTEGEGTVRFALSGGGGDPDLYAHQGSRPEALGGYACASLAFGPEETCEFTPISSGGYYIVVTSTGAFGPARLSMEVEGTNTPPPPPPPPPPSEIEDDDDFDIELLFVNPMPDHLKETAESAASRWEEVIAGDLPKVDFRQDRAWLCGISSPEIKREVEDLLVVVFYQEGPYNTGSANACALRSGSRLPAVSIVSMSLNPNWDEGYSEPLWVHEIGHALGIGALWGRFIGGGADPHYTGPQARGKFDEAGGSSYAGAKVPVEPNGHHWRMSVFGYLGELMVPVVGDAAPLSAITVGALADLGYAVDFGAADSYALPHPTAPAAPPGVVINLGDDTPPTVMKVVDERGRVVQTIRPPEK